MHGDDGKEIVKEKFSKPNRVVENDKNATKVKNPSGPTPTQQEKHTPIITVVPKSSETSTTTKKKSSSFNFFER